MIIIGDDVSGTKRRQACGTELIDTRKIFFFGLSQLWMDETNDYCATTKFINITI